MKNKKTAVLKAISFIMLFALMLGFVSCNPKIGDDSTATSKTESGVVSEADTSQDPNAKYKDTNGNYVITRETRDWEKRKVRVLVLGEAFATYQSDDFTEGSELYGDTLDEAVQLKNSRVEEKYSVELEVFKSDTINNDILTAFQTQSADYDFVMPSLGSFATMAPQGMFYDLTSLDYFDLEAPWFDKNATNAYSIGGKVFFTTGDITILNKVCTGSVLFNKDMITLNQLDNPYELVEEHKWTFDKLVEMAKDVTVLNVLDDPLSKENQYGMLTASGDILAFFGAAGQKICDKDGDDLPYLTITKQESINVLQKLLNEFSTGNWFFFAEDFPQPIWDTSLNAFLEGELLFRPSAFSATTKIRQRSNMNFGILPMPLWNEEQEEYCSYASSSFAVAGVAIPIHCDDPEFSAYMIEAFSAESKNTITPAYYDINLRRKDAMDTESQAMLDIIFGNIIYDVGEVYNFGSIKNQLSAMMRAGDTAIVSKLDSIKELMQTKIDEVIESYEFQ